MIMDRLYGGVCYAGIDTDPELKYPKGAGRVAFSNQQSYIAAISARFVQLQHGEIDKRVRSSSVFYFFFSVPSLEMAFHVNVCHCEDCKCYIRFIAYLRLDCATKKQHSIKMMEWCRAIASGTWEATVKLTFSNCLA